jgi:hypothetical protein
MLDLSLCSLPRYCVRGKLAYESHAKGVHQSHLLSDMFRTLNGNTLLFTLEHNCHASLLTLSIPLVRKPEPFCSL